MDSVQDLQNKVTRITFALEPLQKLPNTVQELRQELATLTAAPVQPRDGTTQDHNGDLVSRVTALEKSVQPDDRSGINEMIGIILELLQNAETHFKQLDRQVEHWNQWT